MATVAHMKMEFVEFLEALGITAEMRCANATRKAFTSPAKGSTTSLAPAATEEGEAVSETCSPVRSRAQTGTLSAPGDFLTELQQLIARVARLAEPDLDKAAWARMSEAADMMKAAMSPSRATPVRRFKGGGAGVSSSSLMGTPTPAAAPAAAPAPAT